MQTVELTEQITVAGINYGPGTVQMTDTAYAIYAQREGLVELPTPNEREVYVPEPIDVAQPEITDETTVRDAVDEAVLAGGGEPTEAPADEPEAADEPQDAPDEVEVIEPDADEDDEPAEDAAPV